MLDKTEFTPTEEQAEIVSTIRSCDDNICVDSYAGTGKTSTLDLIQAASKVKPILCLAFNKAIAKEMEKRFPPTTVVRTANGFDHRIWAKTVGSVTLDAKKSQLLYKNLELSGADKREASESYWTIQSAIGLAKSFGYVPSGKYPHAKRLISREDFHDALEEKISPFVADLIDDLLCKSIAAAYKGFIDFDDQVYMPTLFGGSFPRFPLVLVDEWQDWNAVNHEMLNKAVVGRLCAVGDPWQSIYGFRGAVQDGMRKGAEHFKTVKRKLSISFRCPQAIVEAARWRVPDFRWIKPGGNYEVLESLQAAHIPDGATIICRNNAPLFRLAFRLLAAKRSVTVAGSEIGPKVIAILRKLGQDETPKADLLVAIENWREASLEKSNSPSKVNDIADCLTVFAEFGATRGQAVAYAEYLFKSQGTLKLITGHKAKGQEWDTVFFLDPWLCQDTEQDNNLRYVIQTRSADQCFEINSQDVKWG